MAVSERRVPKYRYIADELQAAIEAGDFGTNGQIPGEKALAVQYGVTTPVVRQATQLLHRRGLVDVRHGIGTFVRDWHPIVRDANARLSADQWGTGKAIWQVDLGDQVPVPEVEIYHVEVVPTYVADALWAPRYLVRDRRFTVEGRPVQLSTSWLDADMVEGSAIERRNTGDGGTYARLAELGYEPAWFREQLRTRWPSEEEAKRLRIGDDEPVLEIVRVARTLSERVVEVNRMILVGEAYVLQYVLPARR